MKKERKYQIILIVSILLIILITATYLIQCKTNISESNLKTSTKAYTYDSKTIENATAEDVVKDITLGYNLGNTFDSTEASVRSSAVQHSSDEGTDYETSWGNPQTTKEMIKKIKEGRFQCY